LLLATFAAACGGKSGDEDGVAPTALTVRIVDPVPTFDGNDLTVRVGEGINILADVQPATGIDRVEVRLAVEEHVIGRLGRAPWSFQLPSWTPGPEGRRLVCVTAFDARARVAETCFLAAR
jgi:hypothetical protein